MALRVGWAVQPAPPPSRNYVDWANLAIFYAVIGLRFSSLATLLHFSFDSSTISYIDLPAIGVFATNENNVNAINFFLMYFKFFKYLRTLPRMDAILITVSSAAFDLFLFIIMAVIVLTGFAAAYYVTFGAQIDRFKTMADTYGSLNRALIGDFDYPVRSSS